MSSRLSCNNEVRANIDIFKTYVKFERAIVVRSKSAKNHRTKNTYLEIEIKTSKYSLKTSSNWQTV